MQIEIIQQILDLLSFKDYEVKKTTGEIILRQDSPIVITTGKKKKTMCISGRLPYKVISKLRIYGKEKFVFSELIDQGHYTYFTDSMENILIVLSHLKDAYDEEKGKEATSVQKIEENKVKLNAWLLEQLNPSLTLDEWLTRQSMNAVKESIQKSKSTTLGRYFREALTNFDKAVNPYLDSSITLKNYITIDDKVHFSGNGDDSIYFECIDDENGMKTWFHRSSLRYFSHYSTTKKDHSIIEISHDVVDNHEKVIVYREENNKQEEWTYNLTYGTIAKNGINTDSFLSRPMTPFERDQLYDQLVQTKKIIDEKIISKIKKENPALQYVYRNSKSANKRPIDK